jgi:hypothetical protein
MFLTKIYALLMLDEQVYTMLYVCILHKLWVKFLHRGRMYRGKSEDRLHNFFISSSVISVLLSQLVCYFSQCVNETAVDHG